MCDILSGMSSEGAPERGRVIGIGGVFFKSADRDRLYAWYRANLGIAAGPHGADFPWRSHEQPQVEHQTVWSVFPADTRYFDPGAAPFMMNYIVDDLDALLAKLEKNSANSIIGREDADYGRFAWLVDPDGNKIELWEPKGT